jgi:hypothetical protein
MSASGFMTSSSIIFTTTSTSSSLATITNDRTIASKSSINTTATGVFDNNGEKDHRVHDNNKIDYSTSNNIDITANATTAITLASSITPNKPLIVSVYSPYTNITTEIETSPTTPNSYDRVDSLLNPSLRKERVLFSVDWEDIDSSSDEDYENDGFDDDDTNVFSKDNNYKIIETSKNVNEEKKDTTLLAHFDDVQVLSEALIQQPLNLQHLEQKHNIQSLDIPLKKSSIIGKKAINKHLQDQKIQEIQSQKQLKVHQNRQNIYQDQKINDKEAEQVNHCSRIDPNNEKIHNQIPSEINDKNNFIINSDTVSQDKKAIYNPSAPSNLTSNITSNTTLDSTTGTTKTTPPKINDCKKSDSFSSVNDDYLIMKDDFPSDGLTIDDGADNLEIMKSEQIINSENHEKNDNNISNVDSDYLNNTPEKSLTNKLKDQLGIGQSICSFLLFVWLFFYTYALLAVVYVSHVEDRFFNTPRL